MSYTIYYGTMSIKLSKDNKYIPMTLAGANNVRDYDGRRARSWQSVSDNTGKLIFTPDEFIEYTKHIIDTSDYLSDNFISGNGRLTPRKFINLSKKCLQNGISFTQAKDLMLTVYWYDKRYDFTPQEFVPKTEDELIDFINADENKDKTLFIGFKQEDKATMLNDMMDTFRKAFKKRSEGENCLHCYLLDGDNIGAMGWRKKIHKYVGKGQDGEPRLVDTFDQAFKFKKVSKNLITSTFHYLKYFQGENNIFSVGQTDKPIDKDEVAA